MWPVRRVDRTAKSPDRSQLDLDDNIKSKFYYNTPCNIRDLNFLEEGKVKEPRKMEKPKCWLPYILNYNLKNSELKQDIDLFLIFRTCYRYFLCVTLWPHSKPVTYSVIYALYNLNFSYPKKYQLMSTYLSFFLVSKDDIDLHDIRTVLPTWVSIIDLKCTIY